MLQIRLSKGGSATDLSGSGAALKSPNPSETVTVACPDHLVIADLPVAKALGAAPSTAAAAAVAVSRSIGRRCRRQLGERVHICVCCDFPIAVYGRLMPCEHAFCLTCARSDSSCYLCDERIQKIQTIKMMEGIYICAAPHCLKSFLKRSEFESHIQEAHSDLLQPNAEDGVNEMDNVNATKPPSTETHGRQLAQPESSTARAPQRSGPSQSANSQPQDREDRPRRTQSREQTPMRPPPQPTAPIHGRLHQQSSDSQTESNRPPPQGFWYPHPPPQGFDNHSGSQNRRDIDHTMRDGPSGQDSPFLDYPHSHPFPPPNFQVPMVINQGLAVPPFGFPSFPVDGSQPVFHAPLEMPRPEMPGQDQGSVLGFPHVPVGMAGFPENYPPWNNAVFANMQFAPPPIGILPPQGYMNPIDGNIRPPFMGDYDRPPEGLHPNANDGKGVLAPVPGTHLLPISAPPPLPPLPRPSAFQQPIHGTLSGLD